MGSLHPTAAAAAAAAAGGGGGGGTRLMLRSSPKLHVRDLRSCCAAVLAVKAEGQPFFLPTILSLILLLARVISVPPRHVCTPSVSIIVCQAKTANKQHCDASLCCCTHAVRRARRRAEWREKKAVAVRCAYRAHSAAIEGLPCPAMRACCSRTSRLAQVRLGAHCEEYRRFTKLNSPGKTQMGRAFCCYRLHESRSLAGF